MATCATDSLRDTRDRAILMVAFVSGGRRRSEIAGLRTDQLTIEPSIPVQNGAPPLARHPSRSHQDKQRRRGRCRISHGPAGWMRYDAWMTASKIDKGSLFRAIGRWGTVSRRALDPQSVNAIIKQRVMMAGLDPAEFSAHGLRSGYLTQAAYRGIPLPEAMEQSRNRSLQQASSYYNNAARRSGRTTRML
ncbi:tyrosine-type recombinase/integrase [Rhizobium laguerreae]|uniref:Tyrosine-type recombinase/integrase n=2 Tax=Rhizobium laguerreae TaxID=1076926 RepID=A0A6N9ZHQ8_9HYPH|nr:tyrosine-type recombinase/integrase [Rhizobium laguerreae]NEH93042.1 tyrosine-type recombinase/integrase [Rhizobium laguerreae]